MKKLPLKIALLLTVFFTNFSAFAQDFQGKAYYQSKTTMDMDEFGGRDMSPDRKKQIMERMKSFLEKEYVLTFNQAESIYKEEEKLAAPGGGRGFGGFGSSLSGGPKYKNVKTKEVIQDQEFFGKQFLIVDEIKNLEWKMGTETKQIGQYTCFKATATTTVDKFDFRSFRRGRGGDKKDEKEEGKVSKDSTKTKDEANAKSDDPLSEIEVPKTIEVVAWYSPQIPVNQGPDDYWGLPGLILEVNADRTTILCTKIVLNPAEKEEIKKPTKGDEVTQAEYNEIVTKKMQEMREMYGGRGGRGGRGGGRGRN
ncbi:GLPGLI family protein [uncultured Winogradskyella sp.]|mgnify:CR=1 FL=1|uniref:GLPGLI family protein n=1 Tax=uncultured Winogradskyella sp. TaxID=395353 RepID=UPI00262BB196|nr:GLPGLI family protein [uncultured Winogradskyella sp.]|tara:strand:- start:13335 stop:14264 length:930 start_codon:yes stop_codon:yes gene_type:complete